MWGEPCSGRRPPPLSNLNQTGNVYSLSKFIPLLQASVSSTDSTVDKLKNGQTVKVTKISQLKSIYPSLLFDTLRKLFKHAGATTTPNMLAQG